MKRPTKEDKAKGEAFVRGVETLLTTLGAKPAEFYRFTIETKAGMLRVSPYPDWVACRFEDVDRAVALLGKAINLNECSGKWNHHYYGTSLEDALADFERCLRRVLP